MSMTVSISKGKKTESNFKHNERKSRLKGQPQEVVESFYETENHKHIKNNLTYLNIDQPHEDLCEVYDQLFGKAIEEYNKKQTRKDRMIGKGKAVSSQVKKVNILKLKVMIKYLESTELQRKKFIESLGGQEIFEKAFEKYKDMTEKDLRKELKGWESQETFGDAYYKKIKNDGKSKTHTEFIAQIGSAEDFNEVKNGEIVKSFDREDPTGKWQKSKKVLKTYIDGFQERNPNLYLVGYSIHMDEASPHIHFDVIPVAERSKTQSRGKKKIGLSKKISFDGALQSQGFTGSPKNFFKAWQNQEASILAGIMEKEMGEKRKSGKTNSIKDIHEYKKLKKLEAEKLEKIANLTEQQKNKETIITSLESQSQDLNDKLSEGKKHLQKVLDWSDNKIKELNSREEKLNSREEKLNSREEKLTIKENTLKQSQDVLKQQRIAFNKKLKETGDLDRKLETVKSTLADYQGNFSKKLEKRKKELLDKKQKELDERLAKQVDTYKKQVEVNKQAYLTEFNRQYQLSLEQREKEVEQREKQFITKIKNFVDDFRLTYISHGLRSMFGKQREIDYYARKYLDLSREEQRSIEKQAFSGSAGLYRKISAFSDAIDHVFNKDLQPLKDLTGDAERDSKYYYNLKNQRDKRFNSPSQSKTIDREL